LFFISIMQYIIIFLVIITFAAISASCYLYFGPYRKIIGENRHLRKEVEEIDEFVDQRVKERTKQLEDMRDSISNFAVQRFELAQELELKNNRILEQKDLTEKQSEKLRLAYEEIKKLESFRQQMVQMMIHDLKNPLNVILNLTDMGAIPARPRNIIRQISYEMLDLILNLLEVQKFKEMKMKVENENIHLNSLIESLTDKLTPLFVTSSIKLKTSVPKNCWVSADRHIVNRIITNIISNSIKYTPSGGLIQINVNQKEKEILLEIRDNGNGISEDQINNMFDMYNQGANKDISNSTSTGIGLTYCKLAVEALGGNIGLKSEHGKGTLVWFTLKQGDVTKNIDLEDIADKIEIKIPELELTEKDIEDIRPYIIDLQSRSIYEVTEILSVTKKLSCFESNRIIRWKESVEETLFSANEKRFKKLIDIV
jgi:signal transduction histidine kinase